MWKIKLLWQGIRESGVLKYLGWILTGTGLIFAAPIPTFSKLMVLGVMNFFVLLAANIMFFVLDNEYLNKKVLINIFTFLMTILASLQLFNQTLGFYYTAQHFQQVVELYKLFISPTTIVTAIVTNITAWILLRIAFQGSRDSEFEGFDILYKGIIFALAALELLFILFSTSVR